MDDTVELESETDLSMHYFLSPDQLGALVPHRACVADRTCWWRRPASERI